MYRFFIFSSSFPFDWIYLVVFMVLKVILVYLFLTKIFWYCIFCLVLALDIVVCMYEHICIYIYTCMYMQIHVSRYACVCEHVYAWVWMCVCMCVFLCMLMFLFACFTNYNQPIVCQVQCSKVTIYIYFTSDSPFLNSICDIMNLANYNALLKLSFYASFINMLHQCLILLCSHFVLEINFFDWLFWVRKHPPCRIRLLTQIFCFVLVRFYGDGDIVWKLDQFWPSFVFLEYHRIQNSAVRRTVTQWIVDCQGRKTWLKDFLWCFVALQCIQ